MIRSKNDSQAGVNKERPRALAAGVIFGGVDCYVFEGGKTALSQSGMVRGLRASDRAKDGDLGRYLARLPEKYSGLSTAPFEFIRPDGGIAHGRSAHDFVGMLSAYAEMFEEGTIHKARLPIARNAVRLLRLLAARGIDEIIYEACDWHPAAIVQAPTVDLASLRDSLRADLSAEFAPVLSRLAALESQSAIVVGNTGPVIGTSAAETRILAPLREAARIRVRAVNNEGAFASQRAKLEDTLRTNLGFPRSGGRAWAMFPTARLGDATDEVTALLKDARDLAGASKPKPVQLSLVANGNGSKRTG